MLRWNPGSSEKNRFFHLESGEISSVRWGEQTGHRWSAKNHLLGQRFPCIRGEAVAKGTAAWNSASTVSTSVHMAFNIETINFGFTIWSSVYRRLEKIENHRTKWWISLVNHHQRVPNDTAEGPKVFQGMPPKSFGSSTATRRKPAAAAILKRRRGRVRAYGEMSFWTWDVSRNFIKTLHCTMEIRKLEQLVNLHIYT